VKEDEEENKQKTIKDLPIDEWKGMNESANHM
jgi:hypothetical protein